MINKIYDKLKLLLPEKHNLNIDEFKYKIIYGNNEDNKNYKSKPFIYNEFEFYSQDNIDKYVYIEQLIIDSIEKNKEINLIENINESIIIFEDKNFYYISFFWANDSKTYRYTKSIIKFEEFKIILSEIIPETTKNIFFMYKYKTTMEIYIFNLNSYNIENELNLDYYNVEINLITPKIYFSKSLKFKEEFKNYKNIFIFIFLLSSIIISNEFYFKNILINKISNLNKEKKIEYVKLLKEKEISENKIKKLNIYKVQNILKNIEFNKIIDFKENYKTELKKLF